MALWVRYARGDESGIGQLDGDVILAHAGSLFDGPAPTGEQIPLAAVRLLSPVRPSKIIGLWNNFRAAAEKQGNAIPAEPLYFLKAPSSCLATGGVIRRPPGYDGKVVYEGEIGIVIGRRATAVAEADAAGHIFGFTAVNDVTALDLIARDPAFAQWARAKSFDGFGAVGPAIATGLDPSALVVRTLVNGRERQNYPASDMIFPPSVLVSRLSHDMTLEPGDLIACGTSLGVGVLRAGTEVAVTIDGIGTLTNRFE